MNDWYMKITVDYELVDNLVELLSAKSVRNVF